MNSVKATRLSKGVMVKDVISLAGGILTEHRLKMIERGTGRPPKADEMAILATILGMPVQELFPEENDQFPRRAYK
jgi:transcriptional regulator with XRE-family HTH domain